MSKLVVYFSHSGITRRRAEGIAREQGADLFEIKAQEPYSEADVDWKDKNSRNVKEYEDKMSRPGIVELPDLSGVHELWIGYPIWWYTHPRIINTFFDQANLAGKQIHLFATSGGTGIDGSVKELRETYPDVTIVDGRRL